VVSRLQAEFAAEVSLRVQEELAARAEHFRDIKENCLKKVLSEIKRFERHFSLREGEISSWIRNTSRIPPRSDWCRTFSFGFEDPPTTHYTILLHDLRNHFPNLVKKLKDFETRMKELCPLHDRKYYEAAMLVYEATGKITKEATDRAVLTEAVLMSLAGYRQEAWPNDRDCLTEKGLLEHVDKLTNKLKSDETIKEYLTLRNTALSLIKEVKEEVIRILHSQRLPGRCNLY